MQCPKCGAELPEGAESCPACGQPVASGSADQTSASGFVAPQGKVVYAGFWLRLLAYLVDSLLVGFVVGFAILRPMMMRAGISADNPWVLFTGTSRQIYAINLAGTMASWLYWALMESSAWQATLGKKMLGLYVTDLAGRRISLARASARYFGKIISTLTLFIGFVMAGFTEKKQALHDKIAGCLVVRNI